MTAQYRGTGVATAPPRGLADDTPKTACQSLRRPFRGDETGRSLLELVFMMALGALVSSAGLGAFRHQRAERAGREAARLLMHELQAVAYDARLSATDMAVVLEQPQPGHATLQVLRDGNGNGVKVAEVAAGIDRPVGAARLAFAEGTARLAIARPVPTTDHAGTLAAGSAPIRFGIAPYISFSPRRTGSSGSVYISGPEGAQYAIRVLGSTGRLRLLCLNERAFLWEGC